MKRPGFGRLMLVALLLLAACAGEHAAVFESDSEPVADEPPTFASSLEIADSISEWWNGDYSNAAQIKALREDGAPVWRQGQGDENQTLGGHLPVTSHYRPVSMSAFGERVVYVEEYTFEDDPYRQRIYTIEHDEVGDEVRVKLWYFNDRESYLGTWQDLSLIDGLTPDDMSPLPDHCDMVVRPLEDGRLHMSMPRDKCQFGDRIFDYQVILSEDEFWFRDRIVDAETMTVASTAGGFTYHELKRTY